MLTAAPYSRRTTARRLLSAAAHGVSSRPQPPGPVARLRKYCKMKNIQFYFADHYQQKNRMGRQPKCATGRERKIRSANPRALRASTVNLETHGQPHIHPQLLPCLLPSRLCAPPLALTASAPCPLGQACSTARPARHSSFPAPLTEKKICQSILKKKIC